MRQFEIYYTQNGVERCRQEYASNEASALSQAKEHFKLFGYGNEKNISLS